MAVATGTLPVIYNVGDYCYICRTHCPKADPRRKEERCREIRNGIEYWIVSKVWHDGCERMITAKEAARKATSSGGGDQARLDGLNASKTIDRQSKSYVNHQGRLGR